MSGDEDIDVVRYAFEQPQPDQVVLNRVNGVVEHGNEDVGEHVACDENSAFFDQQGRMARGMRRMLDDHASWDRPREAARFQQADQ